MPSHDQAIHLEVSQVGSLCDEAVAAVRRHLPQPEHERILRLHREEDRAMSLAAWTVAASCLERMGYGQNRLELLERDEFGRPFLVVESKSVDINVSHAGGIVAAVVGRHVRVGIDIETETTFEASLVNTVFSDGEARWAQQDHAPWRRYQRLWTCKEAVMKADGRGVALAPLSLEIVFDDHSPSRPTLAGALGRTWRLLCIPIDEGAHLALASDAAVEPHIEVRPPLVRGEFA